MTAYLKIENPGVAPAEAFTLLGASTKRGSGGRTIGKFGSGNKHGVSVLLRNGLSPTVFAGNLKMGFGTRTQKMDDGLRETNLQRLVVKFGGKDNQGVSRSSTEDLGFVLDYGSDDWLGVDLALREFVSNSIDRAIDEGETKYLLGWYAERGFEVGSGKVVPYDLKEEGRAALREYRKTARDFQNVVIEIVSDPQVRASAGKTRVFVPLNEDVLRFYNNLGKWFLHFSEPDSLNLTILPKANRNLTDRKAAVIYRRGVRVREFESDEKPSLFDYNLENLDMDESRKVDDWRVRVSAGLAVRDADQATLRTLLASFQGTTKYWEHDFDHYSLDASYNDSSEKVAARKATWSSAFVGAFGENAVISTSDGGNVAARKGYTVVNAPEAFVRAAGTNGVKTPDKVLTQDDREGREVIDATPDALAAVDFVWGVVEANGMTNGKERPKVKVFRKIMEAGGQTLGFYRDGTVYFNADIAGYGSIEGGQNALSQQLLVTALEEVAHHVTGAIDFVRDFQDYVLNLAVKLAKAQAGVL